MHSIDGLPEGALELLPVLDVLLAERSATRAGKKLGLTQPTVSHALARLRVAFGDPLLVREGRGLVPTPRAEALAPAVRRVLSDARRLFAHDQAFDAKTSTRTFSMICPDLLAAFLPGLLARLGRDAPLVRLDTRPPLGIDVGRALGSGEADLSLQPMRDVSPGLVQRALGTVHFCVVARRGHPAVRRGALSREAWLRHSHVMVGTGQGPGVVDEVLRAQGIERRIGFVAPSFLAAPFAVASTDAFFATPRELIEPIASRLRLQLLEPPVPLPSIKVAMTWHERMHADPAHRFFRDLVATSAKSLLS